MLSLVLLTSLATNAQVGIGTASPNASAELDVSSTTKGFLPPRMTAVQRNAIATPAQGLMVYCTNCGVNGEAQLYNGVAWVNLQGGTATLGIEIGSSDGGGIVAYVFVSGDPGYVAGEVHGLIAAISDQSTGIRWHNGVDLNTGATGTALGTGLANTNTIISAQGATATNYAAGLARAYNGGGYSDWYLPSKDELHKLYQNRLIIGGFSSVKYWSSSDHSLYYAWRRDFNTNDQYSFYQESKSMTTLRVRAVRSF